MYIMQIYKNPWFNTTTIYYYLSLAAQHSDWSVIDRRQRQNLDTTIFVIILDFKVANINWNDFAIEFLSSNLGFNDIPSLEWASEQNNCVESGLRI